MKLAAAVSQEMAAEGWAGDFAGPLFDAAFEPMFDKMKLPEERKDAIRDAYAAVRDEIAGLPVARTGAFFDRPEADSPGSGELFTLAVDPEACKGCGLCVISCPKDLIHFSDELNDRGYNYVVFDGDPSLCGGCTLCAVACPDQGIEVWNHKEQQTFVNGELIERGARVIADGPRHGAPQARLLVQRRDDEQSAERRQRPRGRHGFGNRAGRGDVVLLDQERVVQAEAVIVTAAAAYRVLLRAAQSGNGLAGIQYPRGQTLQPAGVSVRLGRGAGQRLQEVERGALAAQQ